MTKRGFTLFEVLISLSLMTVLLLLIGLSIELHLRHMLINRTEVEEAQLARALLEKIAKDLRSSVVALREEQLQVDTEPLTALFGFSSDVDGLLAYSSSDELSESEDEEAAVYGEMPGIYGDLEWIQIDTTMLPRGEMFGSKQVRSGTSIQADRLSPTKTILYYLGEHTDQNRNSNDPQYHPDNLTGSLGRSLDQRSVQVGLFRRQLDRQATRYAFNEGLETEYEQYDEQLAPEVAWIEFSYFDPSAGQEGETGEWLEYWDMDEMQTLPTAVRITLAVRHKQSFTSILNTWTGTEQENDLIIYSLIVPMAVTIDPVEETEELLLTTSY